MKGKYYRYTHIGHHGEEVADIITEVDDNGTYRYNRTSNTTSINPCIPKGNRISKEEFEDLHVNRLCDCEVGTGCDIREGSLANTPDKVLKILGRDATCDVVHGPIKDTITIKIGDIKYIVEVNSYKERACINCRKNLTPDWILKRAIMDKIGICNIVRTVDDICGVS